MEALHMSDSEFGILKAQLEYIRTAMDGVSRRLDDLPCTSMRERVTRVEQQLSNGKSHNDYNRRFIAILIAGGIGIAGLLLTVILWLADKIKLS